MEISSLFFQERCTKQHSLDETLICWNTVANKVLIKKQHIIAWILRSPLLSELNILSVGATGTVPMIHAYYPFIFAARSVYRMPQITALVDPCCCFPRKNCKGLSEVPCQLPGGVQGWGVLFDQPPLTPVVAPQWEKICLCLLLLLPPASSTEDESYPSIFVPCAGRPCLFILICSICGTAAAGRGWQRFVRAFLGQQSWHAASRSQSTNRFKQWSSKSVMILEQEEGMRWALGVRGDQKVFCFWELVKILSCRAIFCDFFWSACFNECRHCIRRKLNSYFVICECVLLHNNSPNAILHE